MNGSPAWEVQSRDLNLMAPDYVTAAFFFVCVVMEEGDLYLYLAFCCPQGLLSLVQLWASGVETGRNGVSKTGVDSG